MACEANSGVKLSVRHRRPGSRGKLHDLGDFPYVDVLEQHGGVFVLERVRHRNG